MDILKKVVLLVAILSISVFMAGCGGDEAADEAGTEESGSAQPTSEGSSGAGGALDELKESIEEAQEEKAEE